MKKFVAALIVSITVALQGCTIISTKEANDDYAVAKVATKCAVEIYTPALPDTNTGSGVHIHDGYVITNEHVVNEAVASGATDEIYVKYPSGRKADVTLISTSPSEDMDIAVLKLKNDTSSCAKLSDGSANPVLMDTLYSVGWPVDNQLTITKGHFQSINRENGFMHITTSIFYGNSGGPIFWKNPYTGEFEVAGINSRLTIAGYYNANHLAMAVPATWIRIQLSKK